MKEKSSILEIQQASDCMTSPVLNSLVLPANPTVTAEYLQQNKQMILAGKKNTCGKNTLTMKSSKTLVQGLISKEKDCSFFWNKQVSELSKKLWLPTETDWLDSGSNLLTGSFLKPTLNSWFSMIARAPLKKNLSPTYSQSLQFFPVEFTGSESTLNRSRKIRFYPTKEQKTKLFCWFGVSRFVFNKTIEYLSKSGTKSSWKSIKTEIIKSLPSWAEEVPYQIKSIAIRDACTAVSTAKLKTKKTGKFNRVSFRSRKLGDFNIYIPKASVKETGVFPRLLGSLNIREKVGEVKHDCRVVFQNGRFFLIKPEPRAIKKPDNQRFPVVALDPGVRTFQTVYSTEFCAKVGGSDFSKIYRLCYCLDKLYSRRRKERTNKFSIKLCRLRWRIKDLISEIHHKLALFLVKTFDLVLIPSFETSEMVTKLHSKVARAMLGWSHYRFKSFLKDKAAEYSCKVIEVNEAYTSKTCTNCGKILNIGSKKTVECSSCGIKIDRDLNGARNIFLKNVILASKDPPMLGRNSEYEPLLAVSNNS